MAFEILSWQWDLIAFNVIALIAALSVQLGVRRKSAAARFGWRSWCLMLGVMVAGSLMAIGAGRQESQRLQEMVGGFAPTYAQELVRLNHAKITPDTKPDDPDYLNLIAAEIRWQKANPFIADVYTFGKKADGSICLLVDSETDYNRNGIIDEEREQRTAIGEAYDKDTDLIDKAFAGEAVFMSTPTIDRWGSWISTFVPMRDDAGKVIAVLGVDYPADRWVEAILFHRGSILGLTGIVIAVLVSWAAGASLMRAEIDRRRKTEAALRASEMRLRTIVDNEPECVMVIDPAGGVREINPSGLRLLEATSEQILGMFLIDLVKPEHRERVREHFKAVACGSSAVGEFEFVTRTGRARHVWMETHSVPLKDEEGKVTSVLSVARDVSARKQAEAERESLSRRFADASRRAGMAEVATGVLHNVGNVLNSVNVSAGMIAERVHAGDPAGLAKAAEMIAAHKTDLPDFLTKDEIGRQLPDYLGLLANCLTEEHRGISAEVEQLQKGIEHIKEIVRTQQTFAKGGTLVAPARPSDLIAEAVQLNITSMERHQIDLVTESADLGEVSLDRHKVLQILINLVGNAKQSVTEAGKSDRRIVLRCRDDEDADFIAFEVVDNGLGIDPANMKRIFQHGFTTKTEGHGFGLHGSANAAAEMGGALTATSAGVGHGANFKLTIPRVAPVDARRTESPSPDVTLISEVRL